MPAPRKTATAKKPAAAKRPIVAHKAIEATPEIKSLDEKPTMTTTSTKTAAEVFADADAREDAFLESLDLEQLCNYASYHHNLEIPRSTSNDKHNVIEKIKARRTASKRAAPSAKHFSEVPLGHAKVRLSMPSGSAKSKAGEYFNLNDQHRYWIPWEREVVLPLPLVRFIGAIRTIATETDFANDYRQSSREVLEYPMSILDSNPDPDEDANRQAALEAGLAASAARRKARIAKRSLADAVDGLR